MHLILNEPEIHDVYGVSKVARTYRMPLEIVSPYDYTFEQAQRHHFYVPWVGLEPTNDAVPLQDFDFDMFASAVLITGSMNHGLPPNILDRLDAVVKVEMFDSSEYLSPTVAIGIFLYEHFKHFVSKGVRA